MWVNDFLTVRKKVFVSDFTGIVFLSDVGAINAMAAEA